MVSRRYVPKVVDIYEEGLRNREFDFGTLMDIGSDFIGSVNKQIAALNLLGECIEDSNTLGKDLRLYVLVDIIQRQGDNPALRVAAQNVHRAMIHQSRRLMEALSPEAEVVP